MALTSEQQSAFDRDGLVALRGAVDPGAAGRMADALWEALAPRGIRRDDRGTWPSGLVSQLGGVAKSGVFEGMASPLVTDVIEGLLGPKWVEPKHWGVPLVTFPEGADWDVPARHWHLDMPVSRASARAPEVARVFVILSPLKPRGGGTLVVTGSHRVMHRLAEGGPMRSADALKVAQARNRWFADLASPALPNRIGRFMEQGGVEVGVPVRVVEMTGEPGDVFFMHPSLMHAFSTNAGDQARMMLTQWVEGRPGAAYGLS